MVDSEQSTDGYKCSQIAVGSIMKNQEMLRLVPDHLETKMYKHPVKILLSMIRYVSDRYKTQEVCDQAVLENGGLLKSVPYQYKTQEMCDKAVHNYVHAIKFVLEC